MTSGFVRSRGLVAIGVRSATLIALATLWVPAARAQLAPGYSGTSSAPEAGTDKDYLFMMRQLGPCLVSNKAEQSVAMLAAPAGSAAEDRAFRALFKSRNNTCLGAFRQRATFSRASSWKFGRSALPSQSEGGCRGSSGRAAPR